MQYTSLDVVRSRVFTCGLIKVPVSGLHPCLSDPKHSKDSAIKAALPATLHVIHYQH